jgi:hypothetical protein
MANSMMPEMGSFCGFEPDAQQREIAWGSWFEALAVALLLLWLQPGKLYRVRQSTRWALSEYATFETCEKWLQVSGTYKGHSLAVETDGGVFQAIRELRDMRERIDAERDAEVVRTVL